jgi:glycopeptide antibiotics resistance protein
MRNFLIFTQIVFLLLTPLWLELTRYLHPIVLLIVWLCYSIILVFVVCLWKQVEITFQKRSLNILLFFYSAGLLVLLFFRPNQQDYSKINLIPFRTILFYLTDKVDFLIAFYNIGANIGLFIPFGLYYRYMVKQSSFIFIVLITTAGICLVEGLQFFTRRGSMDIDDLLLNVSGAAAGYLVYPLVRKVFKLEKEIDQVHP